MKNRRLSTVITIIVLIVNTICISLLYLVASSSMTTIMKQSELENLQESLNVHTNIIEEYIFHQEDLLITFSDVDIVRKFLKNPEDEKVRVLAQKYTEKYFARLEMEKNRYIEGTGLGLNITKLLVDNMCGNIEVHSEYGKGTSFIVTIPQKIRTAAKMGSLEQSRKQELKNLGEGEFFCAPDKKILAVDDNRMNLIVLGELLKRTQMQVEFASGGLECLEKTKCTKYDLILMDHMMPDPDGIMTLHLIKEDEENRNRETPIIVLTANAVDGMKEEYILEGFTDYLSKPIEVNKLEQVLRQLFSNEG